MADHVPARVSVAPKQVREYDTAGVTLSEPCRTQMTAQDVMNLLHDNLVTIATVDAMESTVLHGSGTSPCMETALFEPRLQDDKHSTCSHCMGPMPGVGSTLHGDQTRSGVIPA